MSDATYIELPPKIKKKKFYRTWRFWILFALLAVIVIISYISWWIEQGRLASSYASVDAAIYTVEPEAPITIKEVLVKKGEQVFPGQPLAMIEVAAPAQQPAMADYGAAHGMMPMGEITGRLNASEEAERNMSARLSQARIQEERYQQAHQNLVTEHVRAQLALRATNPGNPDVWAAASAQEAAARARMENAREQYENVSKMRAAMDMELARIRAEIFRKKTTASRLAGQQSPKQPAPPPAPKPVDTTLLAPANGKIVEVQAVAGQQAQQGQPLFFILPSDKGKPGQKWVQAWFPASDQEKLQTGQKAVIHLDNWTFGGKVAEIAPEIQYLSNANPAESAGGNYGRYVVVKIAVENQEAFGAIAPGTQASCEIQTHNLPGLDL